MGRRSRVQRLECPNLRNHTAAPEGQAQWAEWAEAMASTHDQQRCPGCRRWVIWVPRAPIGVQR